MKIGAGITVLVTGSGGGIGLATARACLRQGANVVLTDILKDRLGEAMRSVEGAVLGVEMDISRPQDWERTRAQAEEKFGKVDVLVNNAAIPPCLKPLLDTTVQEFEARIATNLLGAFYGMRTFGPAMRARGSGHIANVSSECGIVPMPRLGDYTAAKYGVAGMTEILREELAEHNVGVTLVLPGLTRSNMTIGMGMDPWYVGEAIVRGIEDNCAYVITHPDVGQLFERRVAAIHAAIGEPAQANYQPEKTPWY